jgi:fatty acid desaturase
MEERSTNPEETCYFCGKRKAAPQSVFRQEVYKDSTLKVHKSVVNTPGGMMVDQYHAVQKHIDIPRCKECKDVHDSSQKISGTVDLSAAAIGAILALIFFWGHGTIWWMIGFILTFAVMADLLIAKKIMRRNAAKLGTKTFFETKTYPPVAALLQEGWKFTVSTEGKK